MKHKLILGILSIVVTLCLLVLALPASVVMAVASVTLTPTEGGIGDSFTVSGAGFPPSYGYPSTPSLVDIYFSSVSTTVGKKIDAEVKIYKLLNWDVMVDGTGTFARSYSVPSVLLTGSETVHGGRYYVYVTYAGSIVIRAAAQFLVTGFASLSADKTEGVVDTRVTIDGSGYTASENITVYYDAVDVTNDTGGDSSTDSSGDFTISYVIPESTGGDHTIKIEDQTGNSEEVTFTVKQEITMSPISGASGTLVKVSGSGFAYRNYIDIYFGGSKVTTTEYVRSSTKGSFSDATFTVPQVAPGPHEVLARDIDDATIEATASFTMAASATISQETSAAAPGSVGTELTISGTGFLASTAMTVSYDATQAATTTSDASGTFSVTFTIPASASGSHTLTVTDGTNSKQFTFYMEAQAPPAPTPLTPLMGDKVEQPLAFDWQDVADPSKPVTYTLQVAPDANFATLVLEKTGLSTSGYTMTTTEELEPVGEDTPYYWRVKSVDGASNESVWTGAGTFYTGGTSFQMPEISNWVKYLLYGVGGLFLLVFGFWLGRRSVEY